MPTIPNLRANWKTTAAGLLSMMLALCLAVHFDAAGNLAMTQRDWCLALIGLFRAGMGLLQTDAGSTPVIAANGETVTAPSHEVPDDPSATPASGA